jgi:hypothetical protein
VQLDVSDASSIEAAGQSLKDGGFQVMLYVQTHHLDSFPEDSLVLLVTVSVSVKAPRRAGVMRIG